MSVARRLLWPAALVVAVGCSRSPGARPSASAAAGTPVARFAGQSVSAEEIQSVLAALSPAQRARYASPEARKAYVADVARFRLLAAQAEKEGLDKDPEVVAAAQRVMVHKLLSRALNAAQPSDADVAAYYEAHKSELQRPETVRAGEIVLNASDAAAKKKAHATAQELLKKIRALNPSDMAGFSELARHYSEDPRTRMFGGDLRYATRDMLTRDAGPEVADAAFKLPHPGDAVEVETARGVAILRLMNHTEPFQPTLEQVRPQIVARLTAERRNAELSAFVTKLETDSGFAVDDAAVQALKVDPSAPIQPLGHPLPDVFAKPAAAPMPSAVPGSHP